jgi:FkbM family methyltransferase
MTTIRQQIARVFRGIARRIEPSGGSPTGHARTDPFFACLAQLRFKPKHVIDVGANRGNWTRTALNYFPDARYTLFEPQKDLLQGSDLAANPRVQIIAAGVGAATSIMKFYPHSRDDSFSFALSEEQAAALGRIPVEAPVVALDDFLPAQGIPYPDMLKIDAEGWDLEVLRGAEKCAAHAEVLLMEAAVMSKAFANTMAAVVSEMTSRGWIVFDITDLNRTQKHGALWLVELAFVRKGGRLDRAVSSFD